MTDTAAWKDTKVRFCDRLVELKRGQLITSERFLADGFEVGRMVIRRLIDNMVAAQMITHHRAHGGTIITICNYDKYQSTQESGSPPDIPSVAHDEPTGSPNKKEDKKIRKEEEESLFRDWYAAYPLKRDPGRALPAYRAALKLTSPDILIEAAVRYRDECAGKEPKYIKHPTTWLRARAWENDLLPINGVVNGTSQKLTPAEGLFAGAAIAIERRQREREQRQANCGQDIDPDVPLLDRR